MELSFKDLRDILGKEEKPTPFKIGDKVFIRTVTYHAMGKVEKIIGDFIFLDDASWIASSGRFGDFLKSSDPEECEPFPKGVWINTKSITDWTYLDKVECKQK